MLRYCPAKQFLKVLYTVTLRKVLRCNTSSTGTSHDFWCYLKYSIALFSVFPCMDMLVHAVCKFEQIYSDQNFCDKNRIIYNDKNVFFCCLSVYKNNEVFLPTPTHVERSCKFDKPADSCWLFFALPHNQCTYLAILLLFSHCDINHCSTHYLFLGR